MDELIINALYQAKNENKAFALVTLTDVKGSTPRDDGSMMIVFADGKIIGSIGGGKVEWVVIQEAIRAINDNKSRNFSHELTPKGDLLMQCGGTAKGYIKVFNKKPILMIVGGGHIGKCLLKLGEFLGFSCKIIDNRSEYKDDFKGKNLIISEYSKEQIIDNNTYIVVATQSHLNDLEFVKANIYKDFAYLGVIGSKNKHKFFKSELKASGINDELISKIYAPIGLNISNQLPEEIAFSILSEILLIKNKGSLEHKKDS